MNDAVCCFLNSLEKLSTVVGMYVYIYNFILIMYLYLINYNLIL